MTDLPDEFVLERSLFNENGVWFYQVPAGQVTNLAPRADAWDPEHPFLTGFVRVLQKGDACFVQLFEPKAADSEAEAPTLFAQCPLQITRKLALDVYVYDCVDSSRYFMLRMEDERSGRRAFVGIGFPNRTTAFNFKATLQDYARYALRQLEAQQLEEEALTHEQTAAGQMSPKKPNLGLPDGATIRINLRTSCSNNGKTVAQCKRNNKNGRSGAVNSLAKVPLIPPPPEVSPSSAAKLAPPSAVTEPTTAIDDEDWSDFTSA
ncbi:unnamed protein product [Peronospora destructor]|uniref:NECAP PHear domain-containing protein n=1 Tax=Peronospora destructor TaxID=86335 RepID=A0AAV0UQA6_9STRA|nr:unnamed protein product [Peronospora destructor]CAI5739127.1 unnamed protein product [Peronospora destructor]